MPAWRPSPGSWTASGQLLGGAGLPFSHGRRPARRPDATCRASFSFGPSSGNALLRPEHVIGGLRFLGYSATAAAAFAVACPSFLSTGVGRRASCAAVNALLAPGMELSIDSASISWTSTSTVHGLVLRERTDSNGGCTFVEIDEVELERGLLGLIRGVTDAHVGALKLNPGVTDLGKVRFLQVLGQSRFARLPLFPKGVRTQLQELAVSASEADNLATETAPTPFQIEMHSGELRATVLHGSLVAPPEVQDAFGGTLRIVGVARTPPEMQRLVEELDVDDGKHAAEEGEVAEVKGTLLSWLAGLMSAEEQPPKSARVAGLLVASENLLIQLGGWLLKDGRLQLMEPAFIKAQPTAAPVKRALARLSPLLASPSATAPDDKASGRLQPSYVRLQVSPVPSKGGRLLLPAPAYRIQLEPTKLAVERSPMLDNIMWLLRSKPQLYKQDLIPAWISLAEVTYDMESKCVEARRMDAMIGGVHLCTWGRFSPSLGMDMTLGLPGETIARMLLPKEDRAAIDHSSVLQINVKGPPGSPKVDWGAASRQLVALAAQARAARTATGASFMDPESLSGRIFGKLSEFSAQQQPGSPLRPAPPPLAEFQWAALAKPV